MRQVAEKNASVRVVAHILDNGAPVSKAMGFAQIVGIGVGETFEEHRFDARVPGGVDDRFMRKHRISLRRPWLKSQTYEQQARARLRSSSAEESGVRHPLRFPLHSLKRDTC